MTAFAEDFDLTTEDDRITLRGVSADDVLEGLKLLHSVREIQSAQSAIKRPELVNVLMSSSGVSTVPAATVRQAQRLAAQRDALLATPTYFYDSLTAIRGAKLESSVRTSIARQRERFEVFDVMHEGRTVLPAFQFDEAGKPRQELRPLISALSSAGIEDWTLWTWLTTPSSYLSGDIPEQVAASSPTRALTAATRFAASKSA